MAFKQRGAVELGADFGVPVNPAFEEALKSYMVNDPVYGEMSAYDLVFELEKLAWPTLNMLSVLLLDHIKDRKGIYLFPLRFALALEDLITMEWAAEGVAGPGRRIE